MTEENKAKTIDGELPRHCAYTMPGVVLALGAEHWSLLKDTYELLSTDMQVKDYMHFPFDKKLKCTVTKITRLFEGLYRFLSRLLKVTR